MQARYYRITLKPDVEQGGYWVDVPALPGVYTQGETIEEAIRNAEDVISLYLEDLAESGEPIPDDQGDEHAVFVRVAVPSQVGA